MQYIQDITLDIYGTALYYVTSKQYDNAARYIRVQLTENGTPIKVSQDLEAHIRALKPDGHSVDNAADVLEDGRVQAELTEQILACEGVTLADIVILDGDTVLSSANFRIECGKAPVGKNVESKDEFLVLVEATKNAREATEAANKAAENVKSTDNSIKEAEEARAKAEEGRVTAEEARVEAERARADEHTQAMEDVDTAIEAAGNATADAQEVADHPPIIQGGTWCHWDKDADTYVDTGKRAVLGIDKVYPSVAEMEADTQPEGTIAIIQSDVNDDDNAKLYRHNGTDWVYLSDLSGFTGPQGPQGDAWVPSVDEDGNLTWEKNGETDPAGTNIRGPIGPAGPEGPQGPPGKDGTGDMEKAVYDPDSRNTDIFGYVDEAVKNVKIDMDPTPTESSQNAVQSGGVYTALAGKQDKLTFDDVPTENSANPVKSGGVYDALQRKSNPNLLDNWYFIGGGSQQGGGQFPINQRGGTKWTTAVYNIDRWLSPAATNDLYVQLDTDCIKMVRTNLVQKSDSWNVKAGEIYTLSFLTEEGLTTGSGAFPTTDNTFIRIAISSASNFHGLLRKYTGNVYGVEFYSTDNGVEHKYYAAKLELGSQQTLAHQENGVWVLNDPPPNYQQELAKCKRYCQVLTNQTKYARFGVGLMDFRSNVKDTHGYVFVPIQVPMRAAPAVETEGSFVLFDGLYSVGVIEQALDSIAQNGINLSCRISNERVETIPAGHAVSLGANSAVNTTKLIFNAEI